MDFCLSPIELYDPLTGVLDPQRDHRHFRGGYKIWPNGKGTAQADLRLMTIGNSTSMLTIAPWSKELAQMMTTPDREVAVFNGAGIGSFSSQEVIRILRDAPGIGPDLVLSLSGICDLGYILNAKNLPFRHRYMRDANDGLVDNGLVDALAYVYPDTARPAEIWCRNQRFAKALCDQLSIEIYVFLQSVQGYGAYPQSPEEEAAFEEKYKVVLKAANKPYGVCITEFYTEVLDITGSDPEAYAHIVDITDAFADCPGAYSDHRYQSATGTTHLAAKLLPYVQARLDALQAGAQQASGVE